MALPVIIHELGNPKIHKLIQSKVNVIIPQLSPHDNPKPKANTKLYYKTKQNSQGTHPGSVTQNLVCKLINRFTAKGEFH